MNGLEILRFDDPGVGLRLDVHAVARLASEK